MPIVASHPVYDYFARRYQWDIKSVVWEPDVYPNEKAWSKLEMLLMDHPAKIMIWEGEPLGKTVEKLEEWGLKSVVFDPCGNRPEKGDFISVMNQNNENLKQVFP